jgi:hypothetical protein
MFSSCGLAETFSSVQRFGVSFQARFPAVDDVRQHVDSYVFHGLADGVKPLLAIWAARHDYPLAALGDTRRIIYQRREIMFPHFRLRER